jgi:hypothetical protein
MALKMSPGTSSLREKKSVTPTINAAAHATKTGLFEVVPGFIDNTRTRAMRRSELNE